MRLLITTAFLCLSFFVTANDVKVDTLDPCRDKGIRVFRHTKTPTGTDVGEIVGAKDAIIVSTRGYDIYNENYISKWKGDSLIWGKRITSGNGNLPRQISILDDGSIAYTTNTSPSNSNRTVTCIDSLGNLKWVRIIDVPNQTIGTNVFLLTDGSCLFLVANDISHIYLIKLSLNGDVLVNQSYVPVGFSMSTFGGVVFDKEKNELVLTSSIYDGSLKAVLVVFNHDLSLKVASELYSEGSMQFFVGQLIMSNVVNGQVILGGRSVLGFPVAMNVTTSGTIRWVKVLNDSMADNFTRLILDNNGTCHFAIHNSDTTSRFSYGKISNTGILKEYSSIHWDGPYFYPYGLMGAINDSLYCFLRRADFSNGYKVIFGYFPIQYLGESENCIRTEPVSVSLSTQPMVSMPITFTQSSDSCTVFASTTQIANIVGDTIQSYYACKVPQIQTSLYETTCDGESIQFGNQTIYSSGTYSQVLTSSSGCDSTITLTVTQLPTYQSFRSETICHGESYQIGNQSFSTNGQHTVTLTTVSGCDSIITLNLTVKPTSTTTTNQTICDGQSYNGFTVAGIYPDTLTSVDGCDSISILNLQVLPNANTTETKTICDGQSYNGYTVAGTYTNQYPAVNGCDSIAILNLQVLPNVSTSESKTICDGQSYNGYSTAGTYTNQYTAANGCDSIAILNLNVLPNSSTTESKTICNGQSYSGYTITGTYTNHYPAFNGCDSTHVLTLTVNPTSNISIDTTICEGESFNGFSQSGLYIDTMTNMIGCDSIVQLNLTVLPVTDPNCMSGLPNELDRLNLTVSPSPFDDYILVNCLCDVPFAYELRNMAGQVVKSATSLRLLNQEKIEAAGLPSGVYLLKLWLGGVEYNTKVVKQ